MVKLITFKCLHCGANLNVDDEQITKAIAGKTYKQIL